MRQHVLQEPDSVVGPLQRVACFLLQVVVSITGKRRKKTLLQQIMISETLVLYNLNDDKR